MRCLIVSVIIILFTNSMQAQQIDPALAGTIATTSAIETNAIKGSTKAQEKIAVMQASISANLQIVKSYEEKMHSYLQNASGAVKNAIEIKQCAELTTDIAKAFKSCADAAKRNPQGLAMATLVSKQVSKCTEEMIGVYSYITTLTLSKEVLLNATERNQITWTVLYKLRRIKSNMLLLQFQIESYTLSDLPAILFPMHYFYVVDGKRIAQGIIRDFSKFKISN